MTSEPDGLILPVGPSSRINCEHVSFPAGTVIGYDPAAWDQTLVMVQLGVLRLTCRSGREADFPAGAIIHLSGLPLAGIGAAGHDPVLLLLLSPRSTTGQSRSASISPTKSETGRRLNE
jgi:hypothetical protein